MSKINCPACGSSRTHKIQYCDESGGGENEILWSHFESRYSPHNVCMDCGKVFGGKNIYLTEKIHCIRSFKFYMGSGGLSHYVRIDANSLKVDYTCTESGMMLELSDKKKRGKRSKKNTWYKTTFWSKEKWKDFLNALEKCSIHCWAGIYRDLKTAEGLQWQVKISILKNETIESYGYGLFPPAWSRFIKIMRKYVSKRIEQPL